MYIVSVNLLVYIIYEFYILKIDEYIAKAHNTII